MRIVLFGKNIFRIYQHHIMEIRFETLCKYKSSGHCKFNEIDINNFYDEMNLVRLIFHITFYDYKFMK